MSPSLRNIIAWILQVILAILFIKAGFDKLRDIDGITKMFEGLGFPGVVGIVVGVAELLGGIGLLIPRTVRPAAIGLIIIMGGALVMHATKIPGGIAGVPLRARCYWASLWCCCCAARRARWPNAPPERGCAGRNVAYFPGTPLCSTPTGPTETLPNALSSGFGGARVR
ncbi:hypothetical protein BEN47_17810 [Hymenobacter lapidarius]|uniref:DoxX family protein n=1 Tax=Hymenobacter lapidarius TaxID=1908237 RepID=A0A1G1SWX9_9BACT|nr:DoxX family protein [Hymenobacter lapidarius]OGX83137.1 hypothetical protein BEN47_17810 [Hymenobacter lapidarius]